MPRKRRFLPYALTEREKRSPKLRKKLASCIKQIEKDIRSKTCKPPKYKSCPYNPIAICRHALRGIK